MILNAAQKNLLKTVSGAIGAYRNREYPILDYMTEPDVVEALELLVSFADCEVDSPVPLSKSAKLTDRIKLVVDLTLAKAQILRLKADDYQWNCHVDETTRAQLLDTVVEIDAMLNDLRAGRKA